MADQYGIVTQAFAGRLAAADTLLDELTEEEASRLGREAAEAVLGPLRVRQMLGADRLDTTQVARLLGISRQAVHKRIVSDTLFGVPGRGTTWFPAWEFDLARACVRDVIPELLRAWRDVAGDHADGTTLLSWAATGQPELDDETPEQWMLARGAESQLIAAARRAARALTA